MEQPRFEKKPQQIETDHKKTNKLALYMTIATLLPSIIYGLKEEYSSSTPKWSPPSEEEFKRFQDEINNREVILREDAIIKPKTQVKKVKEKPTEKKTEEKVAETTSLKETERKSFSQEDRQTIEIKDANSFQNVKPKKSFYYKQINPEDQFENLQLPGKISKYGIDRKEGKILLALRFKPIVEAVEKRYEDFPEELKGVLLSQIIEESTGLLYLPNALGDGGFGVIHMQGETAHEFGLKTYDNCDARVCDGKNDRSCRTGFGTKKNHAKEIKHIINSGRYDKNEMAKEDERLDPILNIDAAARMLLAYYYAKPIKNLSRKESALARYAGSFNFRNYEKDIITNKESLTDRKTLREVEKYFNSINPNFTINGKKADFKDYLEANYRHLENFGLEEYKKLPQIKLDPSKFNL